MNDVNSMSASSAAAACVDAALRSSLLHVEHIDLLLKSCDDRRKRLEGFIVVLRWGRSRGRRLTAYSDREAQVSRRSQPWGLGQHCRYGAASNYQILHHDCYYSSLSPT